MATHPRTTRVALLCSVFFCFTAHSYATGPDLFSYQIEFPNSPSDGSKAIGSIDDRAKRLLAAMACGSEVEFAVKQGAAGEDSTALLIAKMEWAAGHPDEHLAPRFVEPCTFTRYFHPGDLCNLLYAPITCTAPVLQADRDQFAADFGMKFFPYCADWSVTLTAPPAAAPASLLFPPPNRPVSIFDPQVVQLDFFVTSACLIKQVNSSLNSMRVIGNLGTGGSRCHVFWTNVGDWDMSVRNLTRLAFLNAQYHKLDSNAVRNLRDNLLTADGGPAQEHYSLSGCGNTEESTGTAQERADERDWTDQPFWQTIGDILWFLLKILAIIFLAYLIALVLVALLGPVIAGAAIAVVATGAAVLLVADIIPETENHLLMINTSKYLNNQMIIADVPQDSNGANRYRKDQMDLKDWLLSKMQSILQSDFIEYNSRPYHRLSIFAIQNIADFATDDDLRMGARLVLDYTTAKFAVGSQQGRRFVPFRRKREVMAAYIDVDAPNSNGIFDLILAGDQQVGLGLVYAGQTDQMRDNFVSFGAAVQGLYAVTSRYHPEDFVVDLAINKETPIFQRFHYTSGEVFSSGRSFLISAGGLTSGYAYSAVGQGTSDDLGVALPTTLLLRKSTLDDPKDPTKSSMSRTTLGELIRIDGRRPVKPDPDPSYDYNLCVWDGFACGMNVVIPPADSPDTTVGFSTINQLLGETGSCVSKGPQGTAQEWDFIDSRRCVAYRNAPRFFIAVYRQSCFYCQENAGFFEVVDAAPGDDFDNFKAKVTADNPPTLVQVSAFGYGTYHSTRGQTIQFQAASLFGRNAGIVAVDGVSQHDFDQWSFAEGSTALLSAVKTPITSSGDGYIRIWNPRLGKTLELDFRDKAHPARTQK